MVDPVDPVDPAFTDDADFDMEFVDPEPAVALEPVVALDPVLEHGPAHAGIPIDPVIADPPIDDHPVDAPLLEGDHIVAADLVDPPLIANVPAGPLMSTPSMGGFLLMMRFHLFPLMSPMHITLISPFRLLSTHPFGHVPTSVPVMPQFSSAIPPVPPFYVPPFDPASEPLLWTSPPVMPPSDPYHPFHMGYSIEDVLMSFVVQQEALTLRIQELERAQPPPCQCQGQTPPASSQHSRPLPPDYGARLLALEQQVASFLRT
ncbi:hypothetical protein Hanom_Chr11g00974211 [Helianthus anomalus]